MPLYSDLKRFVTAHACGKTGRQDNSADTGAHRHATKIPKRSCGNQQTSRRCRYTSATTRLLPHRISMASRPPSMSEQDLRDLGFGSVVSRESHQRLLNRDGSFNVERRGLHFWSSFSLYHALLTMPGLEHNAFLRAFFFRVGTLSTIGYGNIVPTGVAANVVVTIEALTGLAGFAVATGLLFARLSRPTAKALVGNGKAAMNQA